MLKMNLIPTPVAGNSQKSDLWKKLVIGIIVMIIPIAITVLFITGVHSGKTVKKTITTITTTAEQTNQEVQSSSTRNKIIFWVIMAYVIGGIIKGFFYIIKWNPFQSKDFRVLKQGCNARVMKEIGPVGKLLAEIIKTITQVTVLGILAIVGGFALAILIGTNLYLVLLGYLVIFGGFMTILIVIYLISAAVHWAFHGENLLTNERWADRN